MKIQDRFLLGALAGVIGNIPKTIWGKTMMHYGISEINGVERAAGMLVPAHLSFTLKGQVIGSLADFVIAGTLGVATTYALALTGKDKATLKGALTGQAAWTGLYGVLGTMGASTVKPVSLNTILVELVGHTLYGATTATVVALLGDPKLFNGQKPLFASPFRSQAQ